MLALRFTLLALLSLPALGCSSESARAPTGVWSCNAVRAGNCREWSGPHLATGIEDLRELCGRTASATFANAACPPANVTGRCTSSEQTDVFYEAYPIRAADLPASCTSRGGTFVAK